ncbi:MAG: fimbrillin family protein [Prevotella sp.]|jgi:hypothetical protein|nr:fimbrillin family protein [Prevotella sp.]
MANKSLQNRNISGQNSILFVFFIVSLFCSCSGETVIADVNNSKLLSFSVSVPSWKRGGSASKTESRATPITDPSLGTDKSFNLIADWNDGTGSYSTLIDNETVTCSNNLWKTVKDYYWPGAGSTVNFYAYYPASIPNGTIAHTVGSAPTLAYTVPDNAANQTDILAASSPDISGSTGTAISLTFSHIFAAVRFSVGTSGLPGGTITKITLNNIQYKGTYSFDGTWTPNTTDLKSFSQTVSASTNASTTITSGPTTFMMMPQTLNKDAGITATYSTGTSYTAKISGPWSAGNSYTYNLNKSETAVAGQYLFSDGTWGSYDPAKTVIGIVFSNTTSSTDRSHGWTHGYAMALQNAGSATANYKWYTSDSGNPTGTYITGVNNIMSDKDGYTHSGYLQTSGYAAGIAARGYTAKDKNGNTVAAPIGTSGWYLPSCGQWYDILASLGGMATASGKAYTYGTSYWLRWYNGDISGDTHNYSSLCASNLNVYLNGLRSNGYSVDLFSNSNEYYWSSSECSSSSAYCVDFYSSGNVHLGDYSKTGSFRVRPVLAF